MVDLILVGRRLKLPTSARPAAPGACSLTFRTTFVRSCFTRFAYLSVLSVSAKERAAGLTAAMSTVRQFPPSASFKSRVSFESRNGMCTLRAFPPARTILSRFTRALMQLPKERSERLMEAPSLKRAPRLLVAAARSLPARSMSVNLLKREREETKTLSTACDRDDVRFAPVGSVVRRALPLTRSSITRSAESTAKTVAPATVGPRTGSSRTSSPFVILRRIRRMSATDICCSPSRRDAPLRSKSWIRSW